ncbi:DUF2459 domain-containing protein [Acidisoma sp. 7E03]
MAAALALSACAGPPPATIALASEGDGQVALVTHGWHTDIALPADEATGPLSRFRSLFPGARTLVFGYGKRTFIIAPAHTLGEWIIGPFPGPAAIEVSAVGTDAATAYGAAHVTTLALPPGGAAGLSAFLWRSFATTPQGAPRYIGEGNWSGSLFYEARQRYGLLHTCNTWSAEALAAGGLPIHPAGVVFSGPLHERVRKLSRQSSEQ